MVVKNILAFIVIYIPTRYSTKTKIKKNFLKALLLSFIFIINFEIMAKRATTTNTISRIVPTISSK